MLASVRLLEKTGFRREGYARAYLCINGIWQDHLLYARLQSDPTRLRDRRLCRIVRHAGLGAATFALL